MMGFRKPKLYAKFEVAGFIYYENIRKYVFKRQIRFLSYPLGSSSSRKGAGPFSPVDTDRERVHTLSPKDSQL